MSFRSSTALAETKITNIFHETADKITETITVDNLFQCRNPFTKAFEVSDFHNTFSQKNGFSFSIKVEKMLIF